MTLRAAVALRVGDILSFVARSQFDHSSLKPGQGDTLIHRGR